MINVFINIYIASYLTFKCTQFLHLSRKGGGGVGLFDLDGETCESDYSILIHLLHQELHFKV